MNGQLELFAEPHGNGNGADRRGALPHGPRGVLKALVQQGLDPDATVAAARLIALLDAEAGGEDE